MIENAIADSIPGDMIGEHIYIAAALQVHFARLASRLDAGCVGAGRRRRLSRVWRTAGRVDDRGLARRGERALRLLLLCATLWNEVRVKCLVCGSTKGVGYQEIDGQSRHDQGRDLRRVRQLRQSSLSGTKTSMLEPIADDVASLGLDQLLRGSPWRRAGFNPFLAGY